MSDLASINNKITATGNAFPEIKLADGRSVQTGTIATLSYNLRRYADPAVSAEGKREIEREFEAAIPTVARFGLFELFALEEWEDGGKGAFSEGRRFIGRRAREMGFGGGKVGEVGKGGEGRKVPVVHSGNA